MYQELVHEEEYKGLQICLYLLPEDNWDMPEQEREELERQIRDGHLLWFCARVVASMDGMKLAEDYLGGNCYESVDDFIASDYYDDMKENVFKDACKEIENLIEWSKDK